MRPSSNLNNPLSNIMLVSIKGFKEQLAAFSPELKSVPVVLVASDTHLRSMIRAKKDIAYPFFALRIASVEKRTDGYNTFALSRRGVRISKPDMDDKHTDYYLNLIPTNVSMNIKFLANSIDHIYNFSQRWNLCNTNNLFDFKIEVDESSPIKIKVVTEPSISYPDMELEELGENSVTETTAIINTYIGTLDRHARIVTSQLDASLIDTNNKVTSTVMKHRRT